MYLEAKIAEFATHLRTHEYAHGTVDKYLRDTRSFVSWLTERSDSSQSSSASSTVDAPHEQLADPPDLLSTLTKPLVALWKSHLISLGLAPTTVNSVLASTNSFLRFLGRADCCVKELRIQRRLFRSTERELTKEEYYRLVTAAEASGKHRLALLIETICATGIRVSEVKYITVEAARTGRAEVSLKGKIRTILIPPKLCRKLLKYAHKQKTASGEIFLTRNGRGLSRRQIWAEMKAICRAAMVAPSKVFPHNLRHLFARTFYKACRDVAQLADVLGHSSIETTRIYLMSTGKEHAKKLERLGLIC